MDKGDEESYTYMLSDSESNLYLIEQKAHKT